LRSHDKARLITNLNRNENTQISFIVDEYKKTLNDEDKRKFSRIKIDHVKKTIRDTLTNSRDKKSLLDVLYYVWVLGKDDTFLYNKRYTKTKINEGKSLSNNINIYLYEEEPRKKRLRGTEWVRLEKDSNYRNPRKYPMIFVKGTVSFGNPLGLPSQIIDDVENIKQIMIQYQKSLANKLSITQENVNKIQDTLHKGMSKYNEQDDKKEYLEKIFRILVTRELNDYEDDDDINDVFNSFEFLF